MTGSLMRALEHRGPPLVEHGLAIVAYAELRSIMLAWAGIPWDPVTQAWGAVRRVLAAGVRPGTGELVPHAQALLREASRAALEPAARRAGPWPFDRTIAAGQIGSLAGLEEVFHDAGLAAATRRAADPRLLSLAVRIADFAHRYPEPAQT